MPYIRLGCDDLLAKTWQLDENRLRRYLGHLCVIDREDFGVGAWDESNFERSLPLKSELSIVVLHAREPVGYVIASAYGPSCAHIHRFIVSARFRRKGLATKLLTRFEKTCSKTGIFEITLESLVNRLDANRFYEFSGFTRMDEPRLLQYLNTRGKAGTAQLYSGLSPQGLKIVYRKLIVNPLAKIDN